MSEKAFETFQNCFLTTKETENYDAMKAEKDSLNMMLLIIINSYDCEVGKVVRESGRDKTSGQR